jgi:hypothetical protein
MGAFADAVLAASKRSRLYADRLLGGVTREQFARKPVVGGVTIDTNHPAFVYGHLAIYPFKVAMILGRDPAPLATPPSYDDLFKNGAPCLDDPSGTIYPAMDEVVKAYARTHDVIFDMIAGIPDKDFEGVNQEPRYREYFPTAGQGVIFLLNNHVAMHLGQISAWRRCVGLPPA